MFAGVRLELVGPYGLQFSQSSTITEAVPRVHNKRNALLKRVFPEKQLFNYRSSQDQLRKDVAMKATSVPDYLATADPRTVKPSLVNFDTDFLGMVNFCLRSSDSALSGPSRSKVLNEITNDVFKAIIIGFPPLIDQTIQKFPSYIEFADRSPCVLDPDEKRLRIPSPSSTPDISPALPELKDCDSDRDISLKYIQWLKDLLETGTLHDTMLGGIYDRGYKRLLTVLRDAHCRFPSSRAMASRIVPQDQNICLSLLDLQLDPSMPSYRSKTRELNALANVVSRTILYGGKRERNVVAEHLSKYAGEFAALWCDDDENSQEVLFIRVLALLLAENLAVAERAVSLPTSSLRLFDTYLNAFHRVVELCLSEILPIEGASNDELVQSFLTWEQTLRFNLTSPLWNSHPVELEGRWQLVDVGGSGSLSKIMTLPPEDLISDTQGISLDFLPDGDIDLQTPLAAVAGGAKPEGSWVFKPGPAHLDTCEFYVQSNTK
eukprot:gene32190-38934_t